MKIKMTDSLKKIEQHLLPNGKHFSDEQVKAINVKGNINIVAGPGSGKTTVLAAKLIKLLLEQRRGDKGICCITHTNVAVDEIKSRVRQFGMEDIEYPNFVGTIQSFFDRYFGSKAFGMLLPDKKLRVLDGKQYDDIYAEKFLSEAVGWPYPTPPGYKRRNAHLIILNENKVCFKNTETKPYKAIINKSLEDIFRHGIVNSNQMTSLASWYVSLHEAKLSTAMEERFSYLLLDEAQDTNDEQYELLMRLTKNTGICFQRFGDPYQALYTIYGNNRTDAWNPVAEEENGIAQSEEISLTARFGKRIANLVRNVCYEKYPTFHSDNSDIFDNYFIVFNSEDDLKEKCKGLLQKCENASCEFSECSKKDEIVAPLHADLNKWFPDYTKETSTYSKVRVQNFRETLDNLIRELARVNGRTVAEEHAEMQRNSELAASLGKLIKRLSGNDELEPGLEKLVSPLLKSDSRTMSQEVSSRLIKEFKNRKKESTEEVSDMNHQLCLSTIHGAKGETHRSTILLLDSPVYGGGKGQERFFKTLFPFLIGNRMPYDKKQTKDCLKYAYVALSRPKFLACVAIASSSITPQQEEMMASYGWQKYDG